MSKQAASALRPPATPPPLLRVESEIVGKAALEAMDATAGADMELLEREAAAARAEAAAATSALAAARQQAAALAARVAALEAQLAAARA